MRELLERVLAQLSPEDRLTLTLMYLDDCSVAQIAALTGWTAMNVKVRTFRARRTLRKRMEQLFKQEGLGS